jgi:hypothetical protein
MASGQLWLCARVVSRCWTALLTGVQQNNALMRYKVIRPLFIIKLQHNKLQFYPLLCMCLTAFVV